MAIVGKIELIGRYPAGKYCAASARKLVLYNELTGCSRHEASIK